MLGATSQPAREGECSEKHRLLLAYQTVASDYCRAIQVLSERSGVMSKEDYSRIRDYCEKARARSEAARTEMDLHLAEHGCGSQDR
jgi:hypothetical protein